MKTLLLLSTLIFTNICISQDHSIIGEWKVISVDTGDFYMNAKKDSLLISENYKLRHSEDEINRLIQHAKMAYSNNRLFFDKKGNFNQTSDLAIFKTKYKIDQQKKIIKITGKDYSGNVVEFDMSYEIIDETLYLTIVQNNTRFIAEKVSQ